MIVIGGFNSSNTANLARISQEQVPTYHVASSSCLQSDGRIQHLVKAGEEPRLDSDWLPEGPLVLGLTAGASTPDSEVGGVIQRVLEQGGVPAESVRFGTPES